MNTQTPGPLVVMPCPKHHGKHPFHDHRWLATADAEIERGHDPRPGEWSLSRGSLIAEMRDGDPANARLLASAYTAFDKAGRELGIDAAELAERLDVAELIKIVQWASFRANPDAVRVMRSLPFSANARH